MAIFIKIINVHVLRALLISKDYFQKVIRIGNFMDL